MISGRSFRTPFLQPPDIGVRVWRYLDMPRFVGLLDKQELPLTRLDRSGDPFEGSTPKLNLKDEQEWFEELRVPEQHRSKSRNNTSIHRQNLCRSTYASYWHVNGD